MSTPPPTDYYIEGCTITVIVRVMFENKVYFDEAETLKMKTDVFRRMVICWRDRAQQIWNNQWLYPIPAYRWRCSEVKFHIQYNLGKLDDNDGSWHHVEVKESRAGSWIDGPGGEQVIGEGAWVDGPTATDERAYGFFDIHDDAAVVAHEVGHMLKLEDEYPPNPAPSTPYHDFSASSDDPFCLMMKPGAKYVVVPREHVRSIVADLQPPWSWLCCWFPNLFRLGRLIWELLFPPRPLPDPPGPIPPLPELSDEQIFEMVEGADGRVLAALGNEVGYVRRVGVAFLRAELKHASLRRRWLAAVGLGHVEEQDQGQAVKVLKDALESGDLSIALQAAHSLDRHGSDAGVPVCLNALSSDATMLREPPILARSFADRVLRSVSGTAVAFDVHGSEVMRNEAIKRWKAWWAAEQK